MPERLAFQPPPEETANQPQLELQEETDRVPEPAPETPAAGETTPSPELTPEEARDKAHVLEETGRSLGILYDLLPHEGDLAPDTLAAALAQTELRILSPAARTRRESAIRRDRLHERPKDEFVSEALKPLGLWIHMEGLNRAADRQIAELRRHIQEDL